MKLAWLTDIHLDCVEDVFESLDDLQRKISPVEAVVISGDISVGPHVTSHLGMLEDAIRKPIYFVLGNHDYYFADILGTRRRVVDACRSMSFCRYLGALPCIKVGPKSVIIGSDGWYDALNGNVDKSDMLMNDWIKISDFHSAIKNTPTGKSINKEDIKAIAREICKASVNHVAKGIKSVASYVDSVLIITHVPPFAESYASDKFSGIPREHVLPWYTSMMMGEMLKTAAKTYQHIQFTVLSGHTHGSFEGDILPNLHAKVGKSQYGAPQIAGYIDI